MEHSKTDIVRKVFIVITIVLLCAMSGLLLIVSQVKEVKFNYYGNEQTVRTIAGTVGSFLLQNEIYVGDNVEVSPSLDTPLEDDIEIKIKYKNELAKIDIDSLKAAYVPVVAKIEKVEEKIPFEEEKRNNSTMDRGTEKVVQEGKEGTKEIQYLVKYDNNQECYRNEIASNITVAAQNKVIDVGTKIQLASRSDIVTSISASLAGDGFKQYNIALPVEQQQYAYNACTKYGIDYETLISIMYKESTFNASAVGGGAIGLCQISPVNLPNLNKIGITNLYDPYENITAGAYILSQNLNRYGDMYVALNAYNGRISNNSYASSVLSHRERLIQNGGL